MYRYAFFQKIVALDSRFTSSYYYNCLTIISNNNLEMCHEIINCSFQCGSTSIAFTSYNYNNDERSCLILESNNFTGSNTQVSFYEYNPTNVSISNNFFSSSQSYALSLELSYQVGILNIFYKRFCT